MLTVARLLEDEGLSLRSVVLPAPEVAVRWVAVSELSDPAPFLEGGEVLLTTGLNTAAWCGEWAGYVERLLAVGTAALGLAVGLTHSEAPAALVGACRDRGLNLFEVPRETAFVNISRTVSRRLEEQDVAADRQALVMQRELTQAALQRHDLAAVPKRLAEVIDGAVGTMTADGRWETPPAGDHASRLQLQELLQEVGRLRPQGLRASAVTSDAEGTTVVQPVGLSGTPSLYLAAWAPGRLDDARRSAITTGVALLGLALESRNDQRETDRRLRRRALELLVHGDARTSSLVLAAAAGLAPADIRFPARLQVLVAAGDACDEAMRRVEDSGRPGRLPLVAQVGSANDAELWVVTSPQQTDRLVDDLVGLGFRVGVGSEVRRDEVGRSHAAARHALGHATDAAPIVRWEQLVTGGVLALVGQPAGDSFAEAFLEPLDRYGERRAELVTTLRAFLQHHGRIGPLAHELGVHRNTVRNRLREIEVALGTSLEEPATRVNAWVSLELEATRRLRTRLHTAPAVGPGIGTAPGPPYGG